MQLGELARLIGGVLEGPADKVVTGAAPVDEAGPTQVTFAAERRYLELARTTRAAAVIVATDAPALGVPLIRVDNPRLAWCKALEAFAPKKEAPRGVHPTAVIGEDVTIGRRVWIGPHAVVGDRVEIGDDVQIGPGVFVGDDVKIGKGSRLEANVSVYHGVTIGKSVRLHAGCVVGSDGFGYVSEGNRHRKVPHLGTVIIEDDVELGALVAVDRGVAGATVVGRGTKVGNLVQIAHNVKIGADCLVVSLVGIAGSSVLGDRVTLAGQSAVAGHIEVGSDCVVAARGLVAKDLPSGSFVSGFPARPHRENMKVIAMTQRLPELNEAVAALQRQVRLLQEQLSHLQEEIPATGESR